MFPITNSPPKRRLTVKGRKKNLPDSFTAMMDFPFSLTSYSLKEDLRLLEKEHRERQRGPWGPVFARPGPPCLHALTWAQTRLVRVGGGGGGGSRSEVSGRLLRRVKRLPSPPPPPAHMPSVHL